MACHALDISPALGIASETREGQAQRGPRESREADERRIVAPPPQSKFLLLTVQSERNERTSGSSY
jgi:hypothetical protein